MGTHTTSPGPVLGTQSFPLRRHPVDREIHSFGPEVPCALAGLSLFSPPGTMETGLVVLNPFSHQVPCGLAGPSPFSQQVPWKTAGLGPFSPQIPWGTGGTQSFQPPGALWTARTQSFQQPGTLWTGGTKSATQVPWGPGPRK